MTRLLIAALLVSSPFGPGPLSAQDVEGKLAGMGIVLPAPGKPLANYVPTVRTGNLIFLAGHGPALPWGPTATGKVGKDLTVKQGYDAARNVGINLLASLKAEIGDLNKVKRIVRVFGMVNAVDTLTQHPEVINGASDLLVAVFGERGKHARAAVGMGSLPRNLSVEIEMIVEVEP